MKGFTTQIKNKGFTLVELTLVMFIGLLIASSVLALFNQQLNTVSVIKKQNFLLREAPLVNIILNKIVPRANAFQMFTNTSSVQNDKAVITGAQVLALRFDKATKTVAGNTGLNSTFAVIAFNPSTKTLSYHGNLPNLAAFDPNKPSWTISSKISNATFFIQNGVIRMTITGPDSEELTFSSTTRH